MRDIQMVAGSVDLGHSIAEELKLRLKGNKSSQEVILTA